MAGEATTAPAPTEGAAPDESGQQQGGGAPPRRAMPGPDEQIPGQKAAAVPKVEPVDDSEEYEIERHGKKEKLRLTKEQRQREIAVGRNAQARMREVAEKEARAEGLVEAFKTKGAKALADIHGPEKARQMIEDAFLEMWEADHKYDKTPEGQDVPEETRKLLQERDRLQQELKERTEREESAKKKQETEAQQAERKRLVERRMQDLSSAFDKAGLKRSDPYVFEELLPAASEAWEEIPGITAEQAVAIAQERDETRATRRIATMDDATLERMLGNERVQRFMKYQVQKIRGAPRQVAPPRRDAPPPKVPTDRDLLSGKSDVLDDVFGRRPMGGR